MAYQGQDNTSISLHGQPENTASGSVYSNQPDRMMIPSPMRHPSNAMDPAAANVASDLSSYGTVKVEVVKNKIAASPAVGISRNDDLRPRHTQFNEFRLPSHVPSYMHSYSAVRTQEQSSGLSYIVTAMEQRLDQITDELALLKQDIACIGTETSQIQSKMSENISSLKTGLDNVLRGLSQPTYSTAPTVSSAPNHNIREPSAPRHEPPISYYNTESEQPRRKFYGEPSFGVEDSATGTSTFPMMTEKTQSRPVRHRSPQQIPVDYLANTSRSQTYGRNPEPSRRPCRSLTRQPSQAYQITNTEASNHGSDEIQCSITQQNKRKNRCCHPKLAAFTGEESWEVYFNRFEDVAVLDDWTDKEKLRELLPKLQGKAGDFVFSQLSSTTRRNFPALINEIKHRFRKVELTRRYGSQFSNRNQNPGEPVEDFAAELKRLYHKAYPKRDTETRREDLLRRFLDGSFDHNASFQVEYVKQPTDIDEAVFELVTFQESKKHSTENHKSKFQQPARKVNDSAIDSGDDSGEDLCGISYPKKRTAPLVCTNSKTQTTTKGDTLENKIITVITHLLQSGTISKHSSQMTATNSEKSKSREFSLCYRCREPGHFSFECPNPHKEHSIQ